MGKGGRAGCILVAGGGAGGEITFIYTVRPRLSEQLGTHVIGL